MSNILLRAVTKDGLIRSAACIATELVETARKKHNTAPTATAALGRALIANIFLALNLKNEDTVTMRVLGDGPLGAIITQADAYNNVRGYVQVPECHLPLTAAGKLDVGRAVGKEGFLYVTKDMGLSEPYTGCSTLLSGEIGEDVAYYLNQSEQTPAVVALGVLIDRDHTCLAAGGFFIQALPGAEEKDLLRLEENLQDISSVTSLIMEGLEPAGILQKVFGGIPLEILEQSSWQFSCRCSRERLERVLMGMGKKEIKDMLENDGQAELRCHFCSEYYNFSGEELMSLLREMENKGCNDEAIE